MQKISTGLSGIAGEYYVAAELSRRGFMASITLRNNDSIDIHASNANKIFAIQVKTEQNGVKSWILNKKAELLCSSNLFYVFVSLKNSLTERPDFYVVPSCKVAQYIKNSHNDWLSKPGSKGQSRKDSSMRKFKVEKDKVEKDDDFLERWDLLK